ncbi:MarR family winged helix-turn-helix transcriptional regulator [Selenomonas ruminantium]|jgi:DNA-binding MarR family transcriptional regulator|uniref:MarR family transcriptional regulator n=1 Tax=Selenomonas ruminantium TaxID=971 RepID=A0A927WUF1_SELRU|nr:MarR family transcriptional regulator [Selenomonas ruminantium]MBE6093619.1 MarR family transcriptional regulator [Selenomonas ruminantium]
MKREMIPSFAELERHKELVPEINPAAVIAMLRIKTVSEEIQDSILDVLQQTYHLSEGKFCALIVLHQRGGNGMAPSELAEKVGVTRATISNMLQRMERDGLVDIRPAEQDGRGKIVKLTQAGCDFMEEILPPHYLRVSKLMEKLTEDEQKKLIMLLEKLSA